MKIIGKTDSGLLLSATETELANLVGFYYSGSNGCPKFEPGMEIVVHQMYNQLRELKSNEVQLAQVATKLRMVADLLQLNDPVMRKMTGGEAVE